MKKILFTLAVLSVSTVAFSRSYDGCYQLLDTGAMYPAICLSGTTEESVGGANARLAIFGANTNTLRACLRSTALVMGQSKLEFIMNGRKELVLFNLSTNGNSGDAMVGNTKVKFVRLSPLESRPLKDSAYRGDCL